MRRTALNLTREMKGHVDLNLPTGFTTRKHLPAACLRPVHLRILHCPRSIERWSIDQAESLVPEAHLDVAVAGDEYFHGEDVISHTSIFDEAPVLSSNEHSLTPVETVVKGRQLQFFLAAKVTLRNPAISLNLG